MNKLYYKIINIVSAVTINYCLQFATGVMERHLKNQEHEIKHLVEIVPHTLYFAVLKGVSFSQRLKNDGSLFYFSTDEELVYQNYYCDFGPLNISCLYKYCTKLNKYLQYARGIKGVVHYTCAHPDKKANAAFLMGCYCVLYLEMLPKNIMKLLMKAGQYKAFLDASQFACPFNLKMLDCFQAIAKARAFNFFNFDDFNASEYDLYNKLEYGDINWLLPRKFLAFIGPADNRTAHPPEFYIKYFLKNDVKTVIRLNNILYDSYRFMQVGIQHYDLIFPDGSTPPKNILLKFLYIAESAPAAIAVHCKAGLGRTGSLIGAYLIKHYRMTAREAIAWLRICRPGSVIGQQQIWLEKIQSWLWRIGSQYRLQHYGEGDKIPKHKYGIYSKLWPVEREKLIHRSQISNFMQTQRSANKLIGVGSKLIPSAADSFKNISKFLSSVHGIYQGDKRSNVMVKKYTQSEKSINCCMEPVHKKVLKKPSKKTVDRETQKNALVPKHACNRCGSTQGDKLNEIKAMRTQRHNKIISSSQVVKS